MEVWDMICSLGYVLTLGFCWGAEYKKRKIFSTGEDWLEGLVMALLHLLCQDGFWAGICTLLHIPVNIGTMAMIHLIIGGRQMRSISSNAFRRLAAEGSRGGVSRGGRQMRSISSNAFHRLAAEGSRGGVPIASWEGKTNPLFWLDVAGLLGIAAIIFKYCVSVFSPGLSYTYTNSDAGLHLREAVMVVYGQKVEGMYFSHFHNAMVIEVLKPFLEEVTWYKGFIVADLLFQFLGLVVFFVLMRRMAGGVVGRLFAIAAIPFYYLAYPLNSFYFSFTYWGIGVMLVLYLALLTRQGMEHGYSTEWKWRMMAGCFALVVCYMLFAPVVFITLWLFVAKDSFKEGKWNSLIKTSLELFLIPFVLGIYYCYFDFFGKQGTTPTGSIGNAGGIYSNLLANFVFLLPFMAYRILYEAKNKRIMPECRLLLAFGCMTVLMWFGVRMGVVSQYYYYKCYYPLWALGWAGLIWSFVRLWENNRELVLSFCGVYLLGFVLCVKGYERQFVSSMDEINKVKEHRTELFDIYQWHQIYRSWGREAVPTGKLELYRWVVEYRKNQGEGREVPLLTGNEDYKDCYFYEGVVGLDLGEYYGWRYPKEEIFSRMKENGVDYVVVLKGSEFLENNPDFVMVRDVVYETDCGYILTRED